MNVRIQILPAFLVCIVGCASPTRTLDVPAHAVIGVGAAQLTPDHWIRGNSQASILDRDAIEAQNLRVRTSDPTYREIEKVGETLSAEQVRGWIAAMSVRPTDPLYDEQGATIPGGRLDEIVANVGLESIRASQTARYGLIVRRADLRTFPTRLRVFRSSDDSDIDRFQENALFPGTPVVIAHTSADDNWYFVVSPLYSAWIEKQSVAEGAADEVFRYVNKTPYLVVTGTAVRTVFTRERPEVSELQLEMGVRVPMLSDWPADKPVNGQHPYSSQVIELPWRDTHGALHFTPALLPKTADVAADYLSLNQANLLRQSFKFLGERYGWGHAYNARDCSGFVSEVYRSFGIVMPRNTRDQGVSPALTRITFDDDDPYENRVAVLRSLKAGDLVYIPGHVMMVIGHEHGTPYVIHDTTGITYKDGDGELRRVKLNGVSVTPLLPLRVNKDVATIERVYSVVLMRAP